jgi:hypothetical protein
MISKHLHRLRLESFHFLSLIFVVQTMNEISDVHSVAVDHSAHNDSMMVYRSQRCGLSWKSACVSTHRYPALAL